MRREQPFAFGSLEDVDLARENVETIRVQHHWFLGLFDESPQTGGVRRSESRTDGPDVDVVFGKLAIGTDRFNHGSARRGSGHDRVNLFRNKNFDEPGAGTERAF